MFSTRSFSYLRCKCYSDTISAFLSSFGESFEDCHCLTGLSIPRHVAIALVFQDTLFICAKQQGKILNAHVAAFYDFLYELWFLFYLRLCLRNRHSSTQE